MTTPSNPPPTSKQASYFQVISFLIAGLLLYFALRNANWTEIWEAIRHANYWYLLPLIGITLLSHYLRAWRWQILLQALPDAQQNKVSRIDAFGALMIGYMINYIAPRLGEVARSIILSTREHIPLSEVIGTVVIERLLDIATLLIAICSIGLLFREELITLYHLFLTPALKQISSPGIYLPFLLAVILLFFLILLVVRRANRSATSPLAQILTQFKEGLLTLFHTPNKTGVVLTTLSMWGCYLLMAYLPFVMFGYHKMYHLSLLDAWGIMILGSIGVVIPSPGGTGSYHFITIQTLTRLFNMPLAPATTYAVITHAAQMVLYTIVGIIFFITMGLNWKTLRHALRQ